MPASLPYRVAPGSEANRSDGTLPDGTGIDLLGFPAGYVAVPASTRHLVSVHVGPPIRATCRCDGRVHRRLQEEGDVDFVPAGVPGYWEDEVPTRALVVRMSPALVRRTGRLMGIAARQLRLEPRFQVRDYQLRHIGLAMKAEVEGGRTGGRLYMESLCTALAARVITLLAPAGEHARPVAAQLSARRRRQVLDYIESRIDEDLSLSRLAAVAGLSQSHFKTLFRNSVGKPVHLYVMERRVERARQLLEGGDLPLAQVALEAGFSHQSHLARWIRRCLGTTPAALRRRSG